MSLKTFKSIKSELFFKCTSCSSFLQNGSLMAKHLLAKHQLKFSKSVSATTNSKGQTVLLPKSIYAEQVHFEVPRVSLQRLGWLGTEDAEPFPIKKESENTKTLSIISDPGAELESDADKNENENIPIPSPSPSPSRTVDIKTKTRSGWSVHNPHNPTYRPSTRSGGGQNSQNIRKSTSITVSSHSPQPTCSICQKTFSRPETLVRHAYDSHSKFACPHCQLLLDDVAQLEMHLHSNHPEKLGKYGCRKCTRVFSSWATRLYHSQMEHSLQKSNSGNKTTNRKTSKSDVALEGNQLICPVCQKHFHYRRKYRMIMHCSTNHSKWICPHCPVLSDGSRQLELHVQEHHPDKMKKCGLCPEVFFSSLSRFHHATVEHPGMKMPRPPRPTTTATRPRPTATRPQPRRHKRVKGGLPCPHPHCSRVFLYKSSLSRHLKNNHNSKNNDTENLEDPEVNENEMILPNDLEEEEFDLQGELPLQVKLEEEEDDPLRKLLGSDFDWIGLSD